MNGWFRSAWALIGVGSTACSGQREEVCAPSGFLAKSLSKKSAEENMVGCVLWGVGCVEGVGGGIMFGLKVLCSNGESGTMDALHKVM